MGDQINVQQTRGVGDSPSALEAGGPGALNGDLERSAWVFTGNGATTPTQVMARIMEVEIKDNGHDAVKQLGVGQAPNMAGMALREQNPHLSADPNKSIPNG